MRVLVVNTLYPPSTVGGAERSVQLLARGLAASGHDVSVACVHDESDQLTEDDQHVTVHRFPLRNRHWPFAPERRSSADRLRWHLRDQFNRTATADLVQIIDRWRPDVINTNNLTGFSTEVWRAAAQRSVPVVHTLRDYSLICSRATLFTDGAQCEQRCVPCRGLSLRKIHNSKLVDRVIGISSGVLDLHRRHGCFESTPADVVHNIASVASVGAAPLIDGPPVFGFLGRIEEEKGIEVLLEAAAVHADRSFQIRVAGVGDEQYRMVLQQRFPDLDVEWLGHVDADEFFSTVDTLVVPPIWAEPMGRTVLEAAVRGVSLIHSDAGGVPEIARLSQQRVEVPAGDSSALAEALGSVLDEPEAWRRRHAASVSAVDTFSLSSVVGRHVEIFERAVQASA